MNPARESIAVEQFGPYEVYERLGMGGMASVHRAKKRGPAGFERTVALKRMLSHLTEDRGFVESFVREAKVASLLAHPNIAQTYDFGRINGVFYIAMELVSGHDVRKLLRHAHRNNEPIPLPVVMSILGELCEALDYAHSFVDEDGQPMHIVHRDISPSNMIVSHTGHLKVIDFGIAKANSRQLHTETGTVKGKLGYMAPETALGMAVGPGSDLFSMGVVAWELITAMPLFSARTDFETMRKLREEMVPPPSRYNPTCPPMLDHLILGALQREPEQRVQSARAFRATLDGIQQQFGIQTSSRAVADWIKGSMPEVERGSMMPSGPTGSRPLPLPAGPETQISRPQSRASMRSPALRRSNDEIQLATEIWGEDGTQGAPSPGPDFSMPSSVRGPEPLPYTPLGLSVPSLAPGQHSGMHAQQTGPHTGPHTGAGAVRPPRSKAPLLALAGLAIVAGILGGILYAKRKPTPASKAMVHFVVTPEGASIEVGGQMLGSGSLDTELAPGVYTVAVKRDGYSPWMTSVTLGEGEKQTINVALEKSTALAMVQPDPAVGSGTGPTPPVNDPPHDSSAAGSAVADGSNSEPEPEPDETPDVKPNGKKPRTSGGSHSRGNHTTTNNSGGTNNLTAGSNTSPPDEVKPDLKPDVKPDTKPDLKPDVKPDVKPDIKPDVKPDVKPDPVDAKPKTTPVVGPNVVTKLSGDIPALRSSEGGDVTAKMCIDEGGKVTTVKILKGPPDIASDLQRALMTWRFKPYVNRDQKISPVCFPQSIRVIKK
jgi:eukaryotic-like serine/threonine-protein kinase